MPVRPGWTASTVLNIGEGERRTWACAPPSGDVGSTRESGPDQDRRRIGTRGSNSPSRRAHTGRCELQGEGQAHPRLQPADLDLLRKHQLEEGLLREGPQG